jgi:hypothetical protein
MYHIRSIVADLATSIHVNDPTSSFSQEGCARKVAAVSLVVPRLRPCKKLARIQQNERFPFHFSVSIEEHPINTLVDDCRHYL